MLLNLFILASINIINMLYYSFELLLLQQSAIIVSEVI